jgi:hypothetical protein
MSDLMYYIGPSYNGKIQLPDTAAWTDPLNMTQAQIMTLLISYPYLKKFFSNTPPDTGSGGSPATTPDVDEDWAKLLYDEFVKELPNLTF